MKSSTADMLPNTWFMIMKKKAPTLLLKKKLNYYNTHEMMSHCGEVVSVWVYQHRGL